MPCFKRLVGGLSLQRSGFVPSSVHARFVVNKVELRFRLSTFSIIPPTLQSHLHKHVALTRRTNGRSAGTFLKAMVLENRCALDRKIRSLRVLKAWESHFKEYHHVYLREVRTRSSFLRRDYFLEAEGWPNKKHEDVAAQMSRSSDFRVKIPSAKN